VEHYRISYPNKKVVSPGGWGGKTLSTLQDKQPKRLSFFGLWAWLTAPTPAQVEYNRRFGQPVPVEPDLIDPAGLFVLLFLLALLIALGVTCYRAVYRAGLPGLVSNLDQGDDSLAAPLISNQTTSVGTQTDDVPLTTDSEVISSYEFSDLLPTIEPNALSFLNSEALGNYLGAVVPASYSSSPFFFSATFFTAAATAGALTFYWWSRFSHEEIVGFVNPSLSRGRRRTRIFFLHLAVDFLAPLFVIGFTVSLGGVVTYAIASSYDILPRPARLYEIFEIMFRSSRQFLTYGRVCLSVADGVHQGVATISQVMPSWRDSSVFFIRAGTDLTPPFSDSIDRALLGVFITRKKTILSVFVNVITFFGVVYLLVDHFYLVKLPEVQHVHSLARSYDAVKAYTEVVQYDEWLYNEMVRNRPIQNFFLQIMVEKALLDNLKVSKEILRIVSTQHNVLSHAIPCFESLSEIPQLVRPRLSYLERAAEQAIRFWRCVR